MKTIEFIRRSTPTVPDIAYPDGLTVYNGTDVIFTGIGSTCPNPFRASDMAPWQDVYAIVSLGIYSGVFIENHQRFNRCILLERGGWIPTVNANFNHNGDRKVHEIFLHAGFRDNWRGSKACLTIPPKDSVEFFNMFTEGEEVVVAITTEERKV